MTSLGEGEHHFFRNLCRDFKKIIQSEQLEEIIQQTERFINASREMKWPHNTSAIYRKDQVEKATQKVITEARRYVQILQERPQQAKSQDLIDALTLVENMASQIKAR